MIGMKTLLVQRIPATILAVISVCCVGAYAQRSSEERTPLAEHFRHLDHSGDYKLTRDTVPRRQSSNRMESNRDGVVTLEEARHTFGGSE